MMKTYRSLRWCEINREALLHDKKQQQQNNQREATLYNSVSVGSREERGRKMEEQVMRRRKAGKEEGERNVHVLLLASLCVCFAPVWSRLSCAALKTESKFLRTRPKRTSESWTVQRCLTPRQTTRDQVLHLDRTFLCLPPTLEAFKTHKAHAAIEAACFGFVLVCWGRFFWTFDLFIMAGSPQQKRYEKIEFLGEGQVKAGFLLLKIYLLWRLHHF